jgi:hypothetical protein
VYKHKASLGDTCEHYRRALGLKKDPKVSVVADALIMAYDKLTGWTPAVYKLLLSSITEYIDVLATTVDATWNFFIENDLKTGWKKTIRENCAPLVLLTTILCVAHAI